MNMMLNMLNHQMLKSHCHVNENVLLFEFDNIGSLNPRHDCLQFKSGNNSSRSHIHSPV